MSDRRARAPFVEGGANLVIRPPFLHEQTELRCFWLEGDRARLQALCDRVFNDPSGGALDARPLSRGVALTFARIGKISSLDPVDRETGWCSEIDIAFWVPIVWRERGAVRVSWYMPYVFVDNAYALATGREGYGFNKTLATFQIPDALDGDGPYTVDTQALRRFSPEARAEWQRVMEVRRTARGDGSARESIDAVRSLLPLLLDVGERGGLAGIGAAQVKNVLLKREAPVLFLRQLRDVADPARAAFQEIHEAPARVRKVHGGGMIPGEFTLSLPRCASFPITDDLGVVDGAPVKAAFWVGMDFEMAVGRRLWSADEEPAARRPARGHVEAAPVGRASVSTGATAPAPRRGRQRIAVLGGGIGSLSAAFALTDQPGWQDRYELTVYQMGWRLGGKGASGRNADRGQRIEEHGLHIWFGFYENAFRLMRRCYAELARPKDAPLATWDAAFKPQNLVVLQEHVDGEWKPWALDYPTNDALPGDGRMFTAPADWLRALVRWIRTAVEMALVPPGESAPSVLGQASFASVAALLALADRVARLAATGTARVLADDAGELVDRARRQLAELLLHRVARVGERDDRRRLWLALDLALAALTGILRDDVLTRGFAAIDHYDFTEWLARHGAEPATVASAPIRAIYDLAFGFREGDVRRPDMAAGSTLQGLLRMLFAYAGAFMWKMQAGMGDVVFAPLHDVLRRRGVRFAFFHRVRKLGLGADGAGLATIELGRQATLRDGLAEYAPLVDVKGLPCWPDRPRFEQLVEGDHLARRGVNLESAHADWPDVERRVLRVGEDFDAAILGIPIGALPEIAADLIAQRRSWQRMIENVRTTPTLAAQVWLTPSLGELGWRRGAEAMRAGDAPIQSGYVEPVDTWADMSHLVPVEEWPAGHVAYLCGPLSVRGDAADPAHAADARERVRNLVVNFLERDAGRLWPAAAGQDGRGFRWELLVDPDGREGAARLDAQYVRANVEPSDRYVLTAKGSSRYRLRPDESGVDGLWLAGDWTDNGFNMGCIEATVMSGLLCSRAISGSPERILGELGVDRAAAGHPYEVLEDCSACRVERAVVKWVDPALPVDAAVDTSCCFCGREERGGVLTSRGARLDDLDRARDALVSFARDSGAPDVELFIRANFAGATSAEVAARLSRGRPVATSFNALDLLFPTGGADRAAPAARTPDALLAARALISVSLADGVLHPRERAFVDRFLEECGWPPLRPDDLRPWLPDDLDRPAQPEPILRAMLGLSRADPGPAEEKERAIIARFAAAWGVTGDALALLDDGASATEGAILQRLWGALRSRAGAAVQRAVTGQAGGSSASR